MRILQMVQTLDPATGGVARAVLSLSRAMISLGHDVEVVPLDERSSSWLRDITFPVHALGVGLTNYRYSSRLRSWLRTNGDRYDRVIVHGLWQYLSLAAWRHYSRSDIPYYVFPHGMLDPWFKRTFPLKHLKKWLYWPWADYRVLRDARAVIFTSEEERREARTSFWLYRCHERVSPLGIEVSAPDDGARELFLEKYPALRNRRALLFLGRLHPKKGCDLLIDALAAMRAAPFSLIMAGPDQVGWEKELRARADCLGLTNILFPGMLEGSIKQGALAVAEAFVLPSHQENFGISVAEALAASLPVLISNRVNIWREIEADGAGFVENDDTAGTRRLLERWRDMPENGRTAMRERARQCFERRFEISRAAESLVRILEEPVQP